MLLGGRIPSRDSGFSRRFCICICSCGLGRGKGEYIAYHGAQSGHGASAVGTTGRQGFVFRTASGLGLGCLGLSRGSIFVIFLILALSYSICSLHLFFFYDDTWWDLFGGYRGRTEGGHLSVWLLVVHFYVFPHFGFMHLSLFPLRHNPFLSICSSICICRLRSVLVTFDGLLFI